MIRFTRLSFGLALFAWGCGRSALDEPPSDSMPVSQQPVEPQVCQVTQGTPSLPASDSPQIQWPRGPCLDVTYDDSAVALLPDIAEALTGWSGPACTWLCFSPPRHVDGPATSPATDGRRLHFRQGSVPPSVLVLVSLSYVSATHASFYAEIAVTPEAAQTHVPLFQPVGKVLGFATTGALSQEQSVMGSGFEPGPLRRSLGEVDAQSVCAAYPVCPDGRKGH